MRPRGFTTPLALGFAGLFALAFYVVGLQAEVEQERRARARAEARVLTCGAALETEARVADLALDVLGRCRAVVEAQEEACACWVPAAEGGAR